MQNMKYNVIVKNDTSYYDPLRSKHVAIIKSTKI